MKPILLMALILLTACTGGRKAARHEAKAQKHLARAVWLDPSLASPSQVEVDLPGDTAMAPPMALADPDADSLLAACEAFAAEMLAARNEFAHRLMALPAKAQKASRKVQQVACRYEPFEYNHDLFRLRADGGDTPGIQVEVHPRKALVPCPPQVNYTPTVRVGVASWYRWGFWLLALLWACALWFVAWIIDGAIKKGYNE